MRASRTPPRLRGWVGAGLAFALACAGVPRAVAGRDTSLDEVNRRWRGARCRLHFDVPIRKGRDGDGWSKSKYIVPAKGRIVRKGNTVALLRVSNRDRLPGGVVRAGTGFVADGWSYEDPDGEDGLRLELRFEGLDARARLTFEGNFGKDLDVDDLGDVEKWVRLDFFDVSAADEILEDVARAPATAASPARPPPPAPQPTPIPVLPGQPAEAVVLGVATEPLKVAAGGQVVLVLTYEVRGLSPGRTVDVAERRVLLRGGEALTTLEATVTRRAGVFRSAQPLVVPADLAPGILELRGIVKADGVVSSGRALLEVTSR